MSTFGLHLKPDSLHSELNFYIEKLDSLIREHGFVLMRGFDLSDDEFHKITLKLGEPIDYAFGKILNMQPKTGSSESQFTHRSMALHQDSILNQSKKANYLAFKCKVSPQKDTGGETLLTNNRKFLRDIPQSLLDRLKQSTVAYTSNSTEYYSGHAGLDRPIEQAPIIQHPTLKEEVLFIGLDDPEDENRNYQSWFLNMSSRESQNFMDEIDAYLRAPEVLYEHAWEEGDILICDNFLVCHGRNSFVPGQMRHLIRYAIS